MPSCPSPYRDNSHTARVLDRTKGGLGSYRKSLFPTPTRVWEHTDSVDLLILAVSGELDKATSPLLERYLNQNLPAITVIDLSRVTFLGVAGYRVLNIAGARAL